MYQKQRHGCIQSCTAGKKVSELSPQSRNSATNVVNVRKVMDRDQANKWVWPWPWENLSKNPYSFKLVLQLKQYDFAMIWKCCCNNERMISQTKIPAVYPTCERYKKAMSPFRNASDNISSNPHHHSLPLRHPNHFDNWSEERDTWWLQNLFWFSYSWYMSGVRGFKKTKSIDRIWLW